jgi:ribosomal protein S18 acetylase RimI-like enzyme
METCSISRLQPRDHQAALSLLTQAFRNDPLMAYILGDMRLLGEQVRGVKAIMDYSLAICEQLDRPIFAALESELLCGVALVSIPFTGKWPVVLERQYDQVKEVLGPIGTQRLERYGEITQKERPANPHVFLSVLGVDPSAQGRGHGRMLLNAVQEYSNNFPGSVGVFLDTENPANLSFYEHHGFKMMSHHVLEEVDIWCLFRPRMEPI